MSASRFARQAELPFAKNASSEEAASFLAMGSAERAARSGDDQAFVLNLLAVLAPDPSLKVSGNAFICT